MKLKKRIYTEEDFDKMLWHDCNIYSFAVFPDEFEIAFDLDYIFEWIKEDNHEYYKFWVSPVTLVFENIYDICFDVETNGKLEIDSITRENPKTPKNVEYISKKIEWQWNINCQQGLISLMSVGFKMFIKAEPILNSQYLGLKKRNGTNFNRGIL